MTNRTFFLKDGRGEFRLVIGGEDKITFGPSVPFPLRKTENSPYRPNRPSEFVYAVQVYARDGKTLRAVFPGVYEIREEDIRVTRVGAVEEMPIPGEDEEPMPVPGLGAISPKGEGEEFDPNELG
jgi:hypothetical protein